MRLIVTRPRQDARPWFEGLTAQGHEVSLLPLLEIAPPSNELAVQSAWRGLDRYAAVMFVSGNAVEHFFALRPADLLQSGTLFAPQIRAWATGPGTARALRAAGLEETQVDSPPADARQFDSEALWQRVRHQVGVGQHVLIVRGVDARAAASTADAGVGRDWLADAVRQAGAVVDFVVAYERRLPQWEAAQSARARAAATDGSLWLFSSSEAVANLRRLLPEVDWGAARALATHPRIAQAVREAGFTQVLQSRAALADVVASIESLA